MKTARSKITLSEHEIQNQIIEYLKIKKWFVMRLNSGTMSKEYNGKKYFVRGQEAGTPDLMCFKQVRIGILVEDTKAENLIRLVFIEVKVPGNKPTALQAAKMEELEKYGARCLVIHSLEELQAEGL